MKVEPGQYWFWKDRQDIVKITRASTKYIDFEVIYDNGRPPNAYAANIEVTQGMLVYLQSTPCTYDEAEQKYPEYFI